MVALDKSPNVIYNILNFEEPNVIFIYGVVLILFILIFSRLSINYGIIVGLLFYCILIYYFYTDRNLNNIYAAEKYNQKFNELHRPTNVLIEYPEVVDYLFYIEDIRKYSYITYEEIATLFKEFCILYRASNTDYNLIDRLYQKMVDIKITIMYKINAFIFNTDGYQYTEKMFRAKLEAEKILNNLLNQLILIQKKKIYYNGYNITTKLIDTSGVLPSNIVCDPNPDFNNITNLTPFSMSDLVVF
jgi:hypothetical protein